ncbi:MAG: hypothetical protein HUJ65_07900 [Oscillospiraceae bacterium]|nr:hypothetical protein [Oscillospiraceae bacterium]
MKKKLRIASLIMLIVGVIFVICAFMAMGSTITLPRAVYKALKVIYKVYPVVTVGLFIASFFVKGKK